VSFDPTWLFLSLVISGVGLALFIYGKKQARIPHLVAGLILMVYTYIVTGTLWMLIIAAVVLLALWWAVRQGW
jgi:hypothetical protein